VKTEKSGQKLKMQQTLPIKFIRTNSQGENIEWIFELIDKCENKFK